MQIDFDTHVAILWPLHCNATVDIAYSLREVGNCAWGIHRRQPWGWEMHPPKFTVGWLYYHPPIRMVNWT